MDSGERGTMAVEENTGRSGVFVGHGVGDDVADRLGLI